MRKGRSDSKKINLFHVGILVENLEEAITDFSSKLGVTFGSVQEMHMQTCSGAVNVKVAYSKEGPVHLELIEGKQDDTMFSLQEGEGIHHLGFWSEDFSSYQERKRKTKLPVTNTMNTMPGDPTYWLTDPAKLHGTRIEFVSGKIRRGMEEWMKGEDGE